MAYKGFANVFNPRSANTTLAKHIRKEEEAFKRNYALPAQLEGAGRILYNQSGRGFDWPVRYRIHDVEGNTGETQRNFIRKNLWKTAELEYRGYQATDAIYEKEYLENRGDEGIVKVFDGLVDRLQQSVRQVLGREFYTDGSANGNEEYWHGYESLFGTNGTINITDGTQRTKNAADPVAYPSDTYAGLSTELGAHGGASYVSGSSGVWPDGDADPEYDAWSPIVVVADSTYFDSSSPGWDDQADKAMRFAITHTQRNASLEEQMTTIMLARGLYYSLKNLLATKEEVQVTSENSLRAFGFKNVLIVDGVEVTFDNGISQGIGYGGSYMNMDLRCMHADMLSPQGPVYDIDTNSWKAVVSTLSNLKFSSIRNCFKIVDVIGKIT